MSLENLIGTTLEQIAPDSEAINRLLSSAKRNIADAHIAQVSAENRFDAAYHAENLYQIVSTRIEENSQ